MTMMLDGVSTKHDPAITPRFLEAMALLTGAVTIITAGTGDDRRGLTATAVCSLSADPATILVCVNRSGEARQAIWRAGSFCVNVVSQADAYVSDAFAGRAGLQGADKFQIGQWGTITTGAPALTTALAAVDCELTEKVETHTHTIFMGHVVGLETSPTADAAPLVYFGRSYRGVHLLDER